ncbi:MAG: helix-turn-helix transcriptional regulator [Candidatus Cryptobacteroides sp.]
MAKNYFKSYIWLLETLQSRGPLTLKEIQKLWMNSSINEDGKELVARTFANHILSIADFFGIDIVCDRRNNTYYIENTEDLNGSGIRNWMLNALSLNSLLAESASLHDRIFFDEVPSKDKFLSVIIQAIRDGKKIEIRYQSFRKDYEDHFVFEPYFLKEFKRRWYLYGYKGDPNGCRMLALDRMITATVTTEDFELPKGFSAEAYFGSIYGVRVYQDMKPEKVLLKVSPMQAKHFRSLPLHRSQEEIETHEDYSIFSYYLTTDYDFKQDVLSFGDTVEVLEPSTLRNSVAETVKQLNSKYN